MHEDIFCIFYFLFLSMNFNILLPYIQIYSFYYLKSPMYLKYTSELPMATTYDIMLLYVLTVKHLVLC